MFLISPFYYLTILFLLPRLTRSCIPDPSTFLLLNVVFPTPSERALPGHGSLLYAEGGGFFVLFCSFKISSQNQRFPNDCINSKQTNKPKTKGRLQHQSHLGDQPWLGCWKRQFFCLSDLDGFSHPINFHPILCQLSWNAEVLWRSANPKHSAPWEAKSWMGNSTDGLCSWRHWCMIGCSDGCF